MTVLISFVLIFAGCMALMGWLLWFMYQIPLRIEFFFSKNQKALELYLQISWGQLHLQVLPSFSTWHIKGCIGEKTLVIRPLQKGTINIETFSIPEKFPPFDDMKLLLHKFVQFLPEIFHHINLDRIVIDLTYGFGDPAITGCSYGYYHAINPLISSERLSVSLTPDFEQMVLDGTVKAGICILTPLKLCIRGSRQLLPDIIKMGRNLND